MEGLQENCLDPLKILGSQVGACLEEGLGAEDRGSLEVGEEEVLRVQA